MFSQQQHYPIPINMILTAPGSGVIIVGAYQQLARAILGRTGKS
jgi:hypothetical protein